MADEIFLPKYLKCTKTAFNKLLKQANTLLGYPNELAEAYCTPLIDINGDYYFVVELSLIHISEPTRPCGTSRMPSSA